MLNVHILAPGHSMGYSDTQISLFLCRELQRYHRPLVTSPLRRLAPGLPSILITAQNVRTFLTNYSPSQIYQGGFFTHTGTIQYPRDNVLNATISATVGSIERGYLIYFNFANASIELTPAPSPDPKPGSGSTSKTAPIIGGAIGGALFLALIALITLVTIRIRQKKRIPEAKQETNTNEPDAAPNTERVGVEPTTLVIDQGISPVWAHLPDQEDLPPVYQDHGTLGAVTAPPPTPLELFVAAHPTWISPALGVKLQNAGYNPAFDPDLMSSERWLDKYGVDEFELAALREAFKA